MTNNVHCTDEVRKSRAFTISTFKDRDDWIRLMLAAPSETLPAIAKVLCARIAFHHHVETCTCNPTILDLVAGTGLSKATIYRWLPVLEESGWIGAERTGGRRRNQYLLRVPTVSDEGPFDGLNTETVADGLTVSPVRPKRSHSGDHNGLTAETPKEAKYKAKDKAKKKDSRRIDLDDQDSGRRKAADLDALRSRPVRLSQGTSAAATAARAKTSFEVLDGQIELPLAEQPLDTTDVDFDQFWAHYPKRVAKSDALKAYQAARKQVTAEVILRGAIQYAAERAGHNPRYTKHPAKWLTGGCWSDEPAGKGPPIWHVAPGGGYDHIALGGAMAQQIMDDEAYYGQ